MNLSKKQSDLSCRGQLCQNGQVSIEFAFCMIIVLLMIYGVMMVFRWAGLDLAERERTHENLLVTDDVDEDYYDRKEGPLKQINPYFYTPIKMNAVWDGD